MLWVVIEMEYASFGLIYIVFKMSCGALNNEII